MVPGGSVLGKASACGRLQSPLRNLVGYGRREEGDVLLRRLFERNRIDPDEAYLERSGERAGYGNYFVKRNGGYVTDDHYYVYRFARIPCVNIIHYEPDNRQSSFGSTWHTLEDDMSHIDVNTLKAVGQTVMNVIYKEQ